MEVKLGAQGITAHRRVTWALLSLPLGLLPIAGLLLFGPSFAVITVLLWSVTLLLMAALVRPRPMRLSGLLRVDASGLELDGIPLTRGAQMVDGTIERRVDGQWRVSISTKGQWRRLAFTVKDRRSALAVLSALHVGAQHNIRAYVLSWKRLRSPLVSVTTAMLPLLVGVSLVPLFGAPGLLTAGAIVALYLLMAGALRSLAPQVAIGPDGILLSRMGRSRFIAFEQVREVARWPHPDKARSEGLDLTLAAGEIVQLRTANVQESGQLIVRDPVYARIRTLLRRRRDVNRIAARLGQKRDQSMTSWVLRLRRIGAGAEAGPRVAAVSSDDLVRMLESPMVTPVDRAAAAVALASSDRAPEVRTRIEQLSTAVVSPPLRHALETLAEHPDDDELVARALMPLCRTH